MKTLILGLMAALILTGCNQSSSGGGGGETPTPTDVVAVDNETTDTMGEDDPTIVSIFGDNEITIYDDTLCSPGEGFATCPETWELLDEYGVTQLCMIGSEVVDCPELLLYPQGDYFDVIFFPRNPHDTYTGCFNLSFTAIDCDIIGDDNETTVVDELEVVKIYGDADDMIIIYNNTECVTGEFQTDCPDSWEIINGNPLCHIGSELIGCPTAIWQPHDDHVDVLSSPRTIYSSVYYVSEDRTAIVTLPDDHVNIIQNEH